MNKKNLVRVAVMAAVAAVALTGCTNNDSLIKQYGSGSNQNYISGDGTLTEIKPADRKDPVEFTTSLDTGATLKRSDYQGKVMVVNFWYASCPPCRLEAPDLESLSQKYDSQGVQFLGVNVRDQTDTAKAFERSFKISYPSVIDAADAKVQLAFSGQRGPNATPTTIVLDQKGRVAARVLGEVNKSVLDTLISDTVAENDK
ncbi:TlpA family protein disulfide reductase [Frondihabitans cladoniiphilus]|uniref:TlpA disulfide reductase family protein n=1 Tax=Frondihabitans cladoniiphilus TaxID=715785 RepID=A0ABP8W066_9MICO